jgi:hypothetical protein
MRRRIISLSLCALAVLVAGAMIIAGGKGAVGALCCLLAVELAARA